MPGVQICGRCGSSLRFATAVLDVYPPRAGPWAKRFRRFVPIRRASYRVRDGAAQLQERARWVAGEIRLPLPGWRLLPRLLVPGWAHAYLGQKRRGQVFLAVYLALLVLGILTWGSLLSSFLFGLAFSAHASSVVDVLFQRGGPFPSRLGSAALAMLILSLVIYAPAYWLASGVASSLQIMAPLDPFQAGDVVVYNRWSYARSEPKPGDVVVYNLPMAGQTAGHGQVGVNVITGLSIDRILAKPGADVRWENNQLFINDEPSSLRPLNPAHLPGKLKVKVPDNRYLILPSTVNVRSPANYGTPEILWRNLSLIPREYIEGSAYLRLPLWRLLVIR
jgi:signal peptidase I